MKPTSGLWICCAGLLATGLAGGAPVPRENSLRYQFKEGETLRYVLVEKSTAEIGTDGTKIDATATIDLSWKVVKIEKKGKVRITQTLDRIRMKGETPVGAMSYDSKSDKEPEDEINKVLAKGLNVFAGGQVDLVIDQRGQIDSLKYSEKLAAAVGKLPAELAPLHKSLSEDSLRRMVGQCFPVLPEQAPVKGKSWQSRLKARLDDVDFTLDNKYTSEGETELRKQKLEKITNKPAIAVASAPGSETKLELKKQEASGTAWFSRAAGRLIESTYMQKIDMDVTIAGETAPIKAESTVTLKLLETK